MQAQWRTAFASVPASAARIVPIGIMLLTVAGCAERFNTRWTSPGYRAFNGNDAAATARYYEGAVRETPNEPYYELNLATAYQALGRMDQAAPYYRLVFEHGADVRPARVTAGSANRTLAEIACDNLRQAPPATSAATALPCQPVAAAPPPPPAPVAQAAPAAPPPAAVAPAPTPAPAAPPPAPPAPVRQLAVPGPHFIYFEFDRAVISPESNAIVQAIISDSRIDPNMIVRLVGKADRAGAVEYNQRLSDRRAAVVRDALIAGGVAANRIELRGAGEAEPPVPTPDGQREARNRVVEVTIR
jgi:outer membrane protein OmpA-like peptidoglycan-associated protein